MILLKIWVEPGIGFCDEFQIPKHGSQPQSNSSPLPWHIW
jgi:hypothetical protein